MSHISNDNNAVLKAFKPLKITQVLLYQHIWGLGRIYWFGNWWISFLCFIMMFSRT